MPSSADTDETTAQAAMNGRSLREIENAVTIGQHKAAVETRQLLRH